LAFADANLKLDALFLCPYGGGVDFMPNRRFSIIQGREPHNTSGGVKSIRLEIGGADFMSASAEIPAFRGGGGGSVKEAAVFGNLHEAVPIPWFFRALRASTYGAVPFSCVKGLA